MSKIIGITIGPIFKTIQMASKPAQQWFASYFFSNINKSLCDKLFKANYKIISPYYDENDLLEDGIGKYHDRIIALKDDENCNDLDSLINEVKMEALSYFPKEIYEKNEEKYQEFLKDYIQIVYVILNEDGTKNAGDMLGEINSRLDLLELSNMESSNNAFNIFEEVFNPKLINAEQSKSMYIKNSPLFKKIKIDSNQLLLDNSGNIRDIEDIASNKNEDNGLKSSNYYAYVYADGDRVGKLLSSLKEYGDEKNNVGIKAFSKVCLDYNKAASKLVKEFGGMTIYAGGDDLMFIAPIISRNNETVFELCEKIKDIFVTSMGKAFESYNEQTKQISLSFGVSIQYKKFPLYEANSRTAGLLFGDAKKVRNCIACNCEKHSGQSVKFYLSFDSKRNLNFKKLNDLIKSEFSDMNSDTKTVDIMIESVKFTLESMKRLFAIQMKNINEQSLSKESFCSIFENMFDNKEQYKAKDFIDMIAGALYDYTLDELPPKNENEMNKECIGEDFENKIESYEEKLTQFTSILRFMKFLSEECFETRRVA